MYMYLFVLCIGLKRCLYHIKGIPLNALRSGETVSNPKCVLCEKLIQVLHTFLELLDLLINRLNVLNIINRLDRENITIIKMITMMAFKYNLLHRSPLRPTLNYCSELSVTQH